MQTIVESENAETITFYCPPGDGLRRKVSSESSSDYLEFYIGAVRQDYISGNVDWQKHVVSLSNPTAGSCTEGPSAVLRTPALPRRNAIDGVLGEYDGNSNLLRKYIYGPGIDQPVCMIEVADANATYYYHFDALGSVVALSDSAGDTVQTYEYSVYGEVAVEDANHPNPYMFAGVRYDIEIGLYYNRARYYNPFTGRFLQTDPIGYKDGMNMYTYCYSNLLNRVDPYGKSTWPFGAGEITIDSSCEYLSICVLPEENGEWDCNPTSGKKYEADAIGFYNVSGEPVGLKVPDNCAATIFCDPNDTNGDGKPESYDVRYEADCAFGFLGLDTFGKDWIPSLCTPGGTKQNPDGTTYIWPPPVPSKDEIGFVQPPDY